MNHSRNVLGRVPPWLWLGLLLALWLGGLGLAPLIDVDEGAFSEASREMLASGDWGHTTLHGADRFDKPILVYWFQAASMALFGVNEFAARLPSAVAALMWCLAAFRFADGLLGAQAGRAAVAIVTTCLGVTLIGRAATADALLNALMCWSCLDLWRHLDSQEKGPLRRAFFWMGLGLLTKGPVACLVPGMAVILYLLSLGQLRRLRVVLGDPLAWVILLVTAVPWYAYALHRHGMAFIDGFILQHNVNRFMQAKEGHGGSPFYTLMVAPLLLLPWTPLLVAVGGRLRTTWRTPSTRFLLCWSGFALLFFSLSNTKLPHYLLYGLTPLMLLCALALSELRSRVLGLALAASQLLLFGLLSASQQMAGWLAERTADPLYHTLLSTAAPGPAWWMLAAVGAVWLLVWCWPKGGLADKAALGALLGAFWVVMAVLPWWAEALQGPVRDLALEARKHPDSSVTQWQTRQPSFAFYLGAPTPAGGASPGTLSLARQDRLPTQDEGLRTVAAARGFALVTRDATAEPPASAASTPR